MSQAQVREEPPAAAGGGQRPVMPDLPVVISTKAAAADLASILVAFRDPQI
jgi:hypothetical protein